MNGWRWIIFNLGLGLEKFLAPWFAQTFGAFINGVPYTETVIASPAIIAGKLSALRTGIELSSFSVAVLLIQHVFADNTHGGPPTQDMNIITADQPGTALDVDFCVSDLRLGFDFKSITQLPNSLKQFHAAFAATKAGILITAPEHERLVPP
ncbi:MAG TPA: hypothetical protein VI685_23155 [Candidatus Angelobacter sp.]